MVGATGLTFGKGRACVLVVHYHTSMCTIPLFHKIQNDSSFGSMWHVAVRLLLILIAVQVEVDGDIRQIVIGNPQLHPCIDWLAFDGSPEFALPIKPDNTFIRTDEFGAVG